MATATYDKITRSTMAGFDKECIDLALEAQELGWVGKMSSRGHLIMRAPDDETTMSISRRWTNGRSGLNMRSNLERWKRQQTDTPRFEQFDQITNALVRDQFIERLKDALISKSDDLPSEIADVMQAVYGVVMDREEVAAFAFQCAQDQRISDFGWLSGHPDDPGEVRAWNVNWAVYDRRDGRVIDVGGPRTSPTGEPWDREHVEVAVAEHLAAERRAPEPEVLDLEAEERPYVCEICDRRFLRPNNLGRHMATIHKPEQAFVPDPMEDGLDDLMTADSIGIKPLTSSEPVTVQMDDHLTIVVDGHGETPDGEAAAQAVEAMTLVVDGMGIVAQRMATLEAERGTYETRVMQMRREFETALNDLRSQVETLTTERDNAVGSLSALKALIAEA